jgi:hypothetical protein
LQQLPRIILVNPVFQQRLHYIPNLPLYGFQIHQRRQRKLLSATALNIRLLLMLVAPVRALQRRGLALLPIPAEPLAPPIVAMPFLNDLALQRFAPFSTASLGSIHR